MNYRKKAPYEFLPSELFASFLFINKRFYSLFGFWNILYLSIMVETIMIVNRTPNIDLKMTQWF